MRLIDAQFLETSYYGLRQMTWHLRRLEHEVGRKRVRRLMAIMGLRAIYQKPRTTVPHPEHRKYPYLLRDLVINRSNQDWCSDITYIPNRLSGLCVCGAESPKNTGHLCPNWIYTIHIHKEGSPMLTRTTLFLSNRSQAVRLPKMVAFGEQVREVIIVSEGPRRIIAPVDVAWDDFFAAPGVDLGERNQPAMQEREAL